MTFHEVPGTTKLAELLEERMSKAVVLKKTQNGPSPTIPLKHRIFGVAKFVYRKKDKPTLGILHRNGFVTRVNTESPFKGSVKTGDMILMVNGAEVKFDEKAQGAEATQAGGSGRSKVKSARKKPASVAKNRPEFKEHVQKIFAEHQKKETMAVEITVGRLKTRFPAVDLFGAEVSGASAPNMETEAAILYQFRYLKLGLSMMQTKEAPTSVIVNYTTPDTISNMGLNIGETIRQVGSRQTTTMTEVREAILEGCNTKGYAELLLEFPTSDPLKNAIRNRLTALMFIADRVNFVYGQDVVKLCQEGIEALKGSREPVGIARFEVKEGTVPVQKKPSTRKVNTPRKDRDNVTIQKKIEEHDVPSDWNSQLFVTLPGPKTAQTEIGQPGQQK